MRAHQPHAEILLVERFVSQLKHTKIKRIFTYAAKNLSTQSVMGLWMGTNYILAAWTIPARSIEVILSICSLVMVKGGDITQEL